MPAAPTPPLDNMTDTNTSPQRHATEFRNPPFWDRNVIYFANLKSLFFGNGEQTEELARQVGEIDSYGGRLAPVLNIVYGGGKNVLVVDRQPDPALLSYFKSSLGLSLPKIEQIDRDAYKNLKDVAARADDWLANSPVWIDGYVTDETLAAWARSVSAQTISTTDGSRQGNDKIKLFQFLESRSLPTPDTSIARDPTEAQTFLVELRRRGYRHAAVRSAIGASGIGMIKIGLDEDQLSIPSMLFHEGSCLVQGWLEPGVNGVQHVRSPSVQLFLDETTVYMFDITDQILSESSIHEGNTSPPMELGDTLREELLRQAGEAGTWVHNQGYRGTASVDFLVVRSHDQPQSSVYVCEVNARITGATYPSVLARHLLPNSAWLMRNLRLEFAIEGERLLQLINKMGLLYNGKSASGVVPLNFNFDKSDKAIKGQFVCLAPSVPECIDLLQTMVDTLPFKTTTERD